MKQKPIAKCSKLIQTVGMLYSPTVFGISLTIVLISSLLLLFLCRWLQNFTKYSLFVNVYINFIETKQKKIEIYFPTRWQKTQLISLTLALTHYSTLFFLPLFLEPPHFIGSIKYGMVRTIVEAVIRRGVFRHNLLQSTTNNKTTANNNNNKEYTISFSTKFNAILKLIQCKWLMTESMEMGQHWKREKLANPFNLL